ncbi:hypothetical protein K7X08_006416 [Anisodus acutangulus]|uniref:Uncharacterized protein n=1 Tax=Anisodus acutangulus TaxID=402998 RepID=A0A9Q1MVA5_9SOLA|nr:hypothetical protein K7X08_006416 [Anisodus acutangulus]
MRHVSPSTNADAVQHGGNDDVVAAVVLDVANSAEPAAPIEDVTIHTDLIDDDEMDNGGADIVDNGGTEVGMDMALELNDVPVELEEHPGLYAEVNQEMPIMQEEQQGRPSRTIKLHAWHNDYVMPHKILTCCLAFSIRSHDMSTQNERYHYNI